MANERAPTLTRGTLERIVSESNCGGMRKGTYAIVVVAQSVKLRQLGKGEARSGFISTTMEALMMLNVRTDFQVCGSFTYLNLPWDE